MSRFRIKLCDKDLKSDDCLYKDCNPQLFDIILIKNKLYEITHVSQFDKDSFKFEKREYYLKSNNGDILESNCNMYKKRKLNEWENITIDTLFKNINKIDQGLNLLSM
jgi:hypothetical protein